MEELVIDTDTLVIIGAWNRAIFSQDWVMKNLLSDAKNVKIEYPINGIGSLRFSTEDISFFIFGERLIFKALNSKEQTYRTIISIARQLLRLLSHTPISALGINFVYKTDSLNIFNSFDDTKKLVDFIGREINSQELTRSFSLDEVLTLNLKMQSNDKQSIIDFNYNYTVNTPLDAINVFGDSDDIIIEKSQFSNNILSNL